MRHGREEIEGEETRTIERLTATATRKAFLAEAGFQCGFCTPGFILNTYVLLEADPNPGDATIRLWLESNLCRCTGYEGIERAVKSALRNLPKRSIDSE